MTLRERFTNWLLTPTTEPVIIDLSEPRRRSLEGYASLYSVAYIACAQRKATMLGMLPAAVYRKVGDSSVPLPDHPLSRLLNGQANDLMSGGDLRHWLSLRTDTFGNSYINVEWRGAEPVALWPVEGHVSIDFDRSLRPGHRVRYSLAAPVQQMKSVTVPAGNYFAEEMLHIKTPITKDGVHGESRARLAAEEIGLSVDLERFYSSMLKNGNHQLGHVEIPSDSRVNKEQLESIRRAIDAKSGVGGAGKTPIFGYGAKWVTDQQTMKDASLIEQQQWVLEQVCRIMNVPPSEIFDLTGTTYASAESNRSDFATKSIGPEVTALEKALKPVLEAMGDGDCFVKLNLNALMRGDAESRSQFYREMVYMGAMTRAEVRKKEDLDPIPGLEKPLIPLNYGVVEEDGSVTMLTGDVPADGNQTGVTD